MMRSSEPVLTNTALTDEDFGSTLGPLWGIQMGSKEEPAAISPPSSAKSEQRSFAAAASPPPAQTQLTPSVAQLFGTGPASPVSSSMFSQSVVSAPTLRTETNQYQQQQQQQQQQQFQQFQSSGDMWVYQDPQGQEQGPHPSQRMASWFTAGYFPQTLLVKRVGWQSFVPLIQLLASSPYPPFSPYFAGDRDHSVQVQHSMSGPAVFSLDPSEGGNNQNSGLRSVSPPAAVQPSPPSSNSASSPPSSSMYGKVRQQLAQSSERGSEGSTDVNALLWGQPEAKSSSTSSPASSSSASTPVPKSNAPQELSKAQKKKNRKRATAAAAAAAAAASAAASAAAAAAASASSAPPVAASSPVVSSAPTPANVIAAKQEPKPYTKSPKPVHTAPKQTLLEVMAQEAKISAAEAVRRAVREEEEARELAVRQAATSWGMGGSAGRAPTLREIMELETREEKNRKATVVAERPTVATGGGGGGMDRGGWAPWAPPGQTKSLREIQAEEERGRAKKKAPLSSQASVPRPAATAAVVEDEDFFWGAQKTQVVTSSHEDFPALSSAGKTKSKGKRK